MSTILNHMRLFSKNTTLDLGYSVAGVGARGASLIRWPVGAAVDVCAASPRAELAN